MKSSYIGPILLIIIGLHFSFEAFFGVNLFSMFHVSFHHIWPLALIGYGIWRILEIHNNKK